METHNQKLILIVEKAPLPKKGRFGSERIQEWYLAVKMAVSLAKKYDGAKLMLVTSFAVPGEGSEMDHYLGVLSRDFGISADTVEKIHSGLDTIGQLELADKYARDNGVDLIVVCTLWNSLRIKYLVWRGKIKAEVVVSKWGIPRPREALTDIVLTFIFPVIDLLGGRNWFLRKTRERRAKGKL